MLSFLRAKSPSPARRSGSSAIHEDCKIHGFSLPPEIISHIFQHLALKELLPCKLACKDWKQLVDTEARLRMLEMASNHSQPMVLQAGLPSNIETCEHMQLQLSGFQYSKESNGSLLARMAVCGPASLHVSPMGADDSQVFQNMVISITRLESPFEQARRPTSNLRNAFYGRITNWEISRVTDRIWRYWWDDVPLVHASQPAFEFEAMRDAVAASSDSGFSEGIDHSYAGVEDKYQECGIYDRHQKVLDIGKTIHSATLDLTRTIGIVEQHEYRWHTVHLDVFRIIMSLEDRVVRAGMMGMISNYVVLG